MEEELQCIELIDTKPEDEVLCGDDFTAQAEVDICCNITDILVNEESIGLSNDGVSEDITLYNIIDNKLIQFVYEPRKFSIDVISGNGGKHNIVTDGKIESIEEGKNDIVELQCGQEMQTECIPADCYVLDYSITDLTSTDITENGCKFNIQINKQFLENNNVPRLDT